MVAAMKSIKAVIFDLDGVIVSTDDLHFRAWKRLAEEEAIPFTREDNERLRGVSRMESLAIVLERAARVYTDDEKMRMAERKNGYYRELLSTLAPDAVLPGVLSLLDELRKAGIKMAIGSSSRNAGSILQAIGLKDAFDAVVDGTHIAQSKPDPEVFLRAGDALGLSPGECLVVEDAEAGVLAARAAGMPVLAVGSAANHPDATLRAPALDHVGTKDLLSGRTQHPRPRGATSVPPASGG